MKLKQIPEDFIVEEVINRNPKNEGRFALCWMTNKKYNTEDAIKHISQELGKRRKDLSYSGTKDRRAITKQLISIKNLKKTKLEKISLKDIKLTYFGQSNAPLNLGDHKGNNFKITVRKLKNPKINNKKPILNLFGNQRFSTHNIPIGKAIINANYEKACNIILQNDDWYDKNIKEILTKHPNDYVNALTNIPRRILQLYVHAYQSHIWNETVKKYIQKKPNTKQKKIPIVGFGTRYKDEEVKKIIQTILKKENINERSFIIREIPRLSAEGTTRNILMEHKNLKIQKLKQDDLNKGYQKTTISFYLPKGNYATQLIKQLIFKQNL